jgi:hypothetical protein
MKALIGIMETFWGRILRVVLGLVVVYIGLVTIAGAGNTTAGYLVAIIGVVPIVMGLLGPCLLGFIVKRK